MIYKRITVGLCVLTAAVLVTAVQQRNDEGYDYFSANAQLISRGQQAFVLCNGLFTSNRSLEEVYRDELRIRKIPLLYPSNGDVQIDRENKTVAVGKPGNDPLPIMRAAYREGFGCIVLSPHQTFDDLDDLPRLETPTLADNLAHISWPDGDLVPEKPAPKELDQAKLEETAKWLFEPTDDAWQTMSLMVVYKGDIVYERYENGADMYTKTRTWSAAKSIASTLIGTLVDQGKLKLDEPLPIDWLPGSESDPRNKITLRNVLNMSSGLETVDNGREYETGSGLAYWAGTSSIDGARSRGLIHEPGTHWDYENYDTLLGVLAMKRVLGNEKSYHEYPYNALFSKIGMHNTVPGVDRFGDFVMSSQVYTTARDLARFGLLYMNDGVWNGEQVISKEWIEFCRTPSPSNKGYGGQWWLPNGASGVPDDAMAALGNRGNYLVVIPSREIVIVRRGLDRSARGDSSPNQWDITRKVMEAFAE